MLGMEAGASCVLEGRSTPEPPPSLTIRHLKSKDQGRHMSEERVDGHWGQGVRPAGPHEGQEPEGTVDEVHLGAFCGYQAPARPSLGLGTGGNRTALSSGVWSGLGWPVCSVVSQASWPVQSVWHAPLPL